MKRQSMLVACVIVIAGFMAIGVGNRGAATSDDIPVLQTQVAELDARVAVLEAVASINPIGTPASTEPILALSGDGDQIVSIGVVVEGVYIVTMTTTEPSEIASQLSLTRLRDGSGGLMFMEGSPFSGQTVWSNHSTSEVLFEIDSRVPWVITIERVS